MRQPIRFKQWEYFAEVARCGSIVMAASRRKVSQPAITKALRELEASLGVRLVDRGRAGAQLTVFGKTLIPYAEKAILAVQEGIAEIEALQNAQQGQVRVGTSSSQMSRMLPMAVAELKRSNPLVIVTIVPGDGEEQLISLRLGELDMLVGQASPAHLMGDLLHEELLVDRLMFVARPGHPLDGQRDISISQLMTFPWFVPQRNAIVRDNLDKLLRDMEVPFPENYVEGMVSFATEYVVRTETIAVMPYEFAAEGIEFGKIVALNPDFDATLDPIGITRRNNSDLVKPAQILVQELRRASARLRHSSDALEG